MSIPYISISFLLLALGFLLIIAAMISVLIKHSVQTLRIYQKEECPQCRRLISLVADFCPDCGQTDPFSQQQAS